MAELQVYLKKIQNNFIIKIFSRLGIFPQTDKKINLLKKQNKNKTEYNKAIPFYYTE